MNKTRRLTCSCKTCATNAKTLGLTLPLKADWTPKTDEAANTLAKGTQGIHGMVWMAHDPKITGKVARARLGLKPAR